MEFGTIKGAVNVEAGAGCRPGLGIDFPVPRTKWTFECRDADGNLKWTEEFLNTVHSAGLDDVLSKYFKGAGYTATWYVGLKGTGTIAAADTAASHAGWAEVTAYSEAARQALTLGAVSGGSVNNGASPAVFSINGAATIAGGFLINDSTKGGTAGLLYATADFSSPRTLGSGDTISATVTVGAS